MNPLSSRTLKCARVHVAVIGIAFAPPGHAADWPMARGNPALTGFTAEPVPDQPKLLWSVKTGGPVRGGAAVVGNDLFVGSGDGKIYAINVMAGTTNWVFDTGATIESTPCVVDRRVFVGNDEGTLVALDAGRGTKIWEYSAEDRIVGGVNRFLNPTNEQWRVVIGSYDYHVHCVDAATGDLVWKYATDNFINGTPAIDDGFAYAGGCDGLLHAIDLSTGNRSQAIEINAYIAGSPALESGFAYFGHYGNQFLCVDLTEKKMLWTYEDREFPFFASPALSEKLAVIGGRDKRMHAVHKATGEPAWQARTRGRIDSSPVITVDRVLAGSEDGRIYMWDLTSGDELWNYDLGEAILSSPAVAGGRIFVGCEDGTVYAFGDADAMQAGKPAVPYPELTVHRKPSALAPQAVVSDWPQFLGPDHRMSSGETPLLSKWSANGPPLVWERESGETYAAPVVGNGRVVLFHRPGTEEIVECLDPIGGGRYWSVQSPTSYRDRYGFNGGPRSSPLIHENYVITYGVEGILQCMDLQTGDLQWRKDLSQEYAVRQNFFGVGTSPIVYEGQVIVNLGAPGGPCIAAFELATGEFSWGVEHAWGPSYATPVVARIHRREKLLVFAGGESQPPAGGLLGIDLKTRLLEFSYPLRSEKVESVNASSPLVIDDRIFVSHSLSGKGALVHCLDDGSAEAVWTTGELGVYWMTPVHRDGFIYGFNGRHEKDAELVCLNATTGERKWRWAPSWQEELPQEGGPREFTMHIGRGHLLQAENRFLCLGEMGHLLWLNLGPDLHKIEQRAWLFNTPETFSPPVLSHGLLYVVQSKTSRDGRHPARLLCYDLRGP